MIQIIHINLFNAQTQQVKINNNNKIIKIINKKKMNKYNKKLMGMSKKMNKLNKYFKMNLKYKYYQILKKKIN